MEDFDKGAKRKCTSCSTLFFDFGKFPIICPNCGTTVNTLLTNVSKRGRPPKVKEEDAPVLEDNDNKSIQVEEQINSDDSTDVGVDIENSDDESVEEIIEIKIDDE